MFTAFQTAVIPSAEWGVTVAPARDSAPNPPEKKPGAPAIDRERASALGMRLRIFLLIIGPNFEVAAFRRGGVDGGQADRHHRANSPVDPLGRASLGRLDIPRRILLDGHVGDAPPQAGVAVVAEPRGQDE